MSEALHLADFNYDMHTVQSLMRLFSGRLGNTSLNQVQFTSLHEWLNNTMSRFSAACPPGTASLTREAAKGALTELFAEECRKQSMNPAMCSIDPPAFDAFLQSADPNQDDSIDGPEFVHGAVALKALIAVFIAFGGGRSGSVTMNFSQLLFAMSHVW